MINVSGSYIFVNKDSSKTSLYNVSKNNFNSAEYGAEFKVDYPLTSSISVNLITGSSFSSRKKIIALSNVLNNYSYLSKHHQYSSSYGDKSLQDINLISIPSIFYGSSIKKGSVELDFYVTGNLLAKLQDTRQNGELIETTGSNKGLVAGVVLYNEGFILLTGSWNLDNTHTENYKYNPITADNPKWVYWGAGINQTGTISSSFDFSFEGTHKIPTLMMFAHAEKGELNHSNNPTFINFYDREKTLITGSGNFIESKDITLKNIVRSPFSGSNTNFEKTTYISKIGIYDKEKNLIGVVKLATPVKKTENREFTFKLKMDI